MATRCAVAPILIHTQPQHQVDGAITATHAREPGGMARQLVPASRDRAPRPLPEFKNRATPLPCSAPAARCGVSGRRVKTSLPGSEIATRCAVAPILTSTELQQLPGMAIRAAHARKRAAQAQHGSTMLERGPLRGPGATTR
jgi:hypothetical protein